MFTKKTIRDISLAHKTVLMRADYNVPISDGRIVDDYRIRASLPTVEYLLRQNVRLIICSHLGRPDGKRDQALTMEPVAKRLAKLLKDVPVQFVDTCVGPEAEAAVRALKPGGVLVLENVRFYPQEEADDPVFAKALASYADVFVEDAFAVAHRAHASITGVAAYLPSVAGFLVEREVDMITEVMHHPQRPLVAVLGGAKISDKIDVLQQLIDKADAVLVGGAMANTFLAAKGIDVAQSLVETDDLDTARRILHQAAQKAKEQRFTLTLPFDAVVAHKIDNTLPTRIVDWREHVIADIEHYPKLPPRAAGHIKDDERILDIGPFTAAFYAGVIQLAGAVIWNGDMGVVETAALRGEIGPYAHGTELLIEAMVGHYGNRPFTLVGGGDTVGYIEQRGALQEFDHVSTGGGASLELMAGRPLPGVDVLEDE